MKAPIITFINLGLKPISEVHYQPLNGQLLTSANGVLTAHHQPELLPAMLACLQGIHQPIIGQIKLVSERHYKMLFLAWLDPLTESKYLFEDVLNHFLSQGRIDPKAVFLLLDELKWTQYFKLPLASLAPSLLICLQFVLSVLITPQIICLNHEQAQALKINEHYALLQTFCEQQDISLLILTNDSFWLKTLAHCQSLALDTLSKEKPCATEPFNPHLSAEDQQAWQLYHEIKKHINTKEFQQSSPELQEKVLTIYDQYQQQLNQLDPALIHHFPDSSLSTSDWLQSQSQLTRMLLSETLTADNLITATDDQHTTSTFEPVEEETEMFALPSTSPELEKTNEPIPSVVQSLEEHSAQQSTVLIPPTDIDKIKKPKNLVLKDLFHLKRKK